MPTSESTSARERSQPTINQIIETNQIIWRERMPHGLLQAQELTKVSHMIEKHMKSVFSGYIPFDYQRVIIAASKKIQLTQLEDTYRAQDLCPENLPGQDKKFYGAGIHMLNEWAIDYATGHYLEQTAHNAITRRIRRNTGRREARNYTGSLDNTIKSIYARVTEKEFQSSLFSALFLHDSEELNDIIVHTPDLAIKDVTAFAVDIGRKKEAGQITFPVRNDDASNLAGIVNICGVADIKVDIPLLSLLPPPLLSILTVETDLLFSQTSSPIQVIEAGAIGFMTGIVLEATSFYFIFQDIVHTAIHEAIHGYSLSESFNGLIPSKIEKVPILKH